MKTTIILYFIGLVIAYLMVGIHNKIAIKHSATKLSSWWVLGSLLSITIFMAVLTVSFVFELLKRIEIQKIVFNTIAVAFKWLYKSTVLSFKWIFETIKKSKLLGKWFINGIKKLHFALIPPEKGIDLLLNMFSNLGDFIEDNAYSIFFMIMIILIITGFAFALMLCMIKIGMLFIIIPLMLLLLVGLVFMFEDL